MVLVLLLVGCRTQHQIGFYARDLQPRLDELQATGRASINGAYIKDGDDQGTLAVDVTLDQLVIDPEGGSVRMRELVTGCARTADHDAQTCRLEDRAFYQTQRYETKSVTLPLIAGGLGFGFVGGIASVACFEYCDDDSTWRTPSKVTLATSGLVVAFAITYGVLRCLGSSCRD